MFLEVLVGGWYLCFLEILVSPLLSTGTWLGLLSVVSGESASGNNRHNQYLREDWGVCSYCHVLLVMGAVFACGLCHFTL